MNELERMKMLIEKGYTYDCETGKIYGVYGKELVRKINGYNVTRVWYNNKSYKVLSHRFAWYYHYGKLPENNIDHINRVRDDNRIENLRDVTTQENGYNRNAKGYYFFKRDKKWRAYIKTNQKTISLGTYDTEQEASNAYQEAKKKYHKL